jgi:hypothetical protein
VSGSDDLGAKFTRPARAKPAAPVVEEEGGGVEPVAEATPKVARPAPSPATVAPSSPEAATSSPRFRQVPKLYNHRVSLDLSDDVYNRLLRAGFDAGPPRVPHGTVARHMVALALDDVELMARAVELARVDVKAAAEARRK